MSVIFQGKSQSRSISLPEDMWVEVEEAARRENKNRSGLFQRLALEELERHRQKAGVFALVSEAQSMGLNVEGLLLEALEKKTQGRKGAA